MLWLTNDKHNADCMICTVSAYYPHLDCKAEPAGYWQIAGGALVIEHTGVLTAIKCKWTEYPRPADADGLKALEVAEPGRVQQKMIVCRTKVPFRLPDGTWVMNTDALKWLAAA